MKEIINSCKKKLKEANIESWNIDYLVLLCAALNKSKEEIIFNPDKINPTAQQIAKIDEYINRRINREPISHIINNREFYGLDFYVDKNVLDPRPDSEILVHEVIKIASDLGNDLKMLEIGPGSGCLSIAIAKNCTNISSILAADISEEALKICQKNINDHNLENKIKTIKSDVFGDIRDAKFDIIISNPPYIRSSEIENLQDEVRIFEPRLALDGGGDGLDFYRKIIDQSPNFLNKNGYLVFEIGFDQANDLRDLAKGSNFNLLAIVKDLAQNDRVVILRKHD